MEKQRAKQILRDLLLLQRDFLLAGGIHAATNQSYRFFIQKRKFLLKTYELDTDPNTLHILHDHPFSYNQDIWDCAIELCPLASMRIIRFAMIGVNRGQLALKNYGENYWGIDARAEHMYNNLDMLKISEFPEMN